MDGEKSATLFCRHGTHDKTYVIRLTSLENGLWITSVLYGRRGSNLRPFKPMKQPGTYREADAVFWKLYSAQLDEYTEDEFGRRLQGRPPIEYAESKPDPVGRMTTYAESSATRKAKPQSKGELAEAIVNKLGRKYPQSAPEPVKPKPAPVDPPINAPRRKIDLDLLEDE